MSKVHTQSFSVAATLAAERIVAITAAQTVGYPTSGQVLPIGVTVDDVKDTTDAIPVATPGSIVKVLFDQTVLAAGFVASDTSGRGVSFSLANTTSSLTLASAYAGILVDAAVAGTGSVLHIYVLPGLDRVAG